MARSVLKRARLARPAERERDDKYFSKVIGKALDLLGILRATSQPQSLNELTLRVGLAKSSVFRMLYTLEASSYIERDPSGRYQVAAGVRTWGREQLISDLLEAAGPPMRELSREFGETVSLAARFENRIEVIATIESPQLIRMGNTVGRILPPHASSLGKAITAHQPEEVRERLIRSYGIHRFTTETITDEIALKRELERVRDRGYSIDEEETVLEGRCFGAAIIGANGEVYAAISLSLPKMRAGDKHAEARLVAALRRTAQHISEVLQANA